MKGHRDYFGSHELCSRQHPLFNHLGIEELLMFALIEIYEHKVEQGTQGPHPLSFKFSAESLNPFLADPLVRDRPCREIC
jgi:hypothetical protein